MSGPPQFFYTPAPHERAYYGVLFQAADVERTGAIGGGKAVEFFTRSKVPIAHLKYIWTAADQPPTNALDPRKFAVAVRMIQLEQNGVKPTGPDLANVPGNLRPVYFEGIQPPVGSQGGPPQQALPQQPAQQQQASPRGSFSGQQQQPLQPQMVPHTLPRDPSLGVASVAGSAVGQHQLAVQDPYSLTPSEQARYEQIFPEYAKDSQYVYGSEAIALFGKSGLSQQQLALIWNMVDVPVDNRLDRVEFAIAMHLIVCVSRKNLPLPPALPIALKQLKSQQPQSPGALQHNGGPPPGSPLAVAAPPATVTVTSQFPSPRAMQAPEPVPQNSGGSVSGLSGMPGPPPIQPQGGISISDAFEGLGANGDTGSITSYRGEAPGPASPVMAGNMPSMTHITPKVIETVAQAHAPMTMNSAPEPEAEPKSTKDLAAAYKLGESHEELEKLRTALQKLQAENISLKATLGTLTEEEQDVQKELSATIAEITNLAGTLTTLRAQVLSSKSRLLQAAAELKAAKEKKGTLTDLISEATATKRAIDEACDGIENANEAAHAPPPASASEPDLFGAWGDDSPVPARLPGDSSSGNKYGMVQSSHVDKEPEPHYNEPAQHKEPGPEQPMRGLTISYDRPLAAPAGAVAGMYSGGGYHNRNASAASGFGEVMGGAPDARSDMTGSFDALPHTPSIKEIEDLQSKCREAEDVARDAEESRRQLAAQLDELRRVADEAESKARAASEKPVKKKSIIRRGAQKHDAKEAARLAAEAKDKKEALLQAQAYVKDAEVLATSTRQEAERLRKEADDAQMRAATNASMQQNQQSARPAQGPGLSSNYNSNGYFPEPSEAPLYSFNKPESDTGPAANFGGPPHDGGFSSNVMGSGGGIDIPTPSGDDPYSNPFG